jgi:uncharacterized membrane protein
MGAKLLLILTIEKRRNNFFKFKRERVRVNESDVGLELEGFSEEGTGNPSSDDHQPPARRFRVLRLHFSLRLLDHRSRRYSENYVL